MFGRSSYQDTDKIDRLYVKICTDIDEWLSEHTLSEYEKVFVTKNKHPIIGLHSTTSKALDSILEIGFNNKHPDAVILGKTGSYEINWPEAMFASPYIKYDKINDRSGRNPNHYISYTNGFHRNIIPIFNFFDRHGFNYNKLKETYSIDDNLIEFPMIISAFKNTSAKNASSKNASSKNTAKKIIIDIWIESYDPNNQVIMLGVIWIKYTFDELQHMYSHYKDNVFDKILLNDITYKIEWFNNIKQEYVIVK